MLNCHRDEIAFVKNTSEGISIVANGIDWQWGDRIVTTNVEYPANIYPWMEVARGRGVKLVMVEETDGPDGTPPRPPRKNPPGRLRTPHPPGDALPRRIRQRPTP